MPQACTEPVNCNSNSARKTVNMLRSNCQNSFGCGQVSFTSRVQRIAPPILCGKKNNSRQSKPSGFGSKIRQQRIQHKARISPKLQEQDNAGISSELQLEPNARTVAAASLQYVPKLKAGIEQQLPDWLTKPVVADVLAKAESVAAVLQAAYDADSASLADADIEAMLLHEYAVGLSMQLANAMTADLARERFPTARTAFKVWEKNGVDLGGAQFMFRLAPLVGRLMCSAVAGFSMFLWMPAKERYISAAVEAEQVLLNEPELLAKGLDNPITGVSDWKDYLQTFPSDADVMLASQGLSSDSCVARHISMANGSSLYILAANQAFPSIRRAVAGSSEPWAVLACDPFVVGKKYPDSVIFYGLRDMFEALKDPLLRLHDVDWDEDEDEEEDSDLTTKAVGRPCGILQMF